MSEYHWKTVSVVAFDELMQALDRADLKGYMPDAIKEAWEAFNWKPEQPAQQEPVAWATYLGECAHVLWGKDRPDYPIRYEVPLYTSPQPAQQEPVAVVSGYYGGQCVILPIDPARIYNSNTPLYTSPQPCPTCEALARTVMLDQTSHDTHRKPTDEMVVAAARVLSDRQAAACNVDCGDMWKLHGNDFIDDARAALEAAHGIKGDA